MPDPALIQGSLQQIADFILKYAVTLAALGALTVGLIEAYKKLFGTLAGFHRLAVRRWLYEEKFQSTPSSQVAATIGAGGHYGVEERAKADGSPSNYDANKAFADLLHLTTGVRHDSGGEPVTLKSPGFRRNVSVALFELELATMMAQIQEAADAALNNPRRYENWFYFLTRGCDTVDIDKWLNAWSSPKPSGGSDEKKKELAEAYARIRLLMRRQLDSFQTVTAFRWREWNQLWAWLVGGVLLFLAQYAQAKSAGVLNPNFFTMFVVSLAGGILAPIAKDLVDALAKMKSRG